MKNAVKIAISVLVIGLSIGFSTSKNVVIESLTATKSISSPTIDSLRLDILTLRQEIQDIRKSIQSKH